MKISKKDALLWFRFFAMLPEEEELLPRQQEILYATFAQIEAAVEHRDALLAAEIPGRQSLSDRTYFTGDPAKFPKGCRSCLLGTGLSAIRKTNKCNLNCKFCYYYGQIDRMPPVGEGMWEIGGTKFYARDLDLLLSIYPKPSGISYVYLEPFMEIEEYYPVIRKFHEAGIYQHMYTNGTLATEENLRALGEAGLDELRFDLAATHCSDKVIDAMATAKRFIPMVGIETPMSPEFEQEFLAKKDKILQSGIDFMNCAELHLNENNLPNFLGENLDRARQGYLSPIWSHEVTLRLQKLAATEGWDMVLHDCCNRTKFARDLNLRSKDGSFFGTSNYTCEFERIPYEAFLPILEDDSFAFLEEEPLPKGYRAGDIVL